MPRQPIPKRRTTLPIAYAVCAVLLGITAWMVFATPADPGATEDDGVYLSSAKALAEGAGYRLIALPGEPRQTKYPVLYPWLLSLLWRAGGDVASVLRAAQALNLALSAMAAGLAYLALRRQWALPPWLALPAVLVAFASPHWWDLSRLAMAEHLYAVLAFAALVTAGSAAGAEHSTPSARRGLLLSAAAGLLAGGAFTTRTLGVAAAAAVVLGLAARRRWREAIVAALASTAVMGAWVLWRWSAMASNRAIPQASAFTYDLDYAAWTPGSAAEAARVAYLNVSRLALSALDIVTSIPQVLPPEIFGPKADAIVLLLMVIISAVLIMAGLWITRAKTSLILHLYLAIYGLIIVFWPFHPARFLVPLMPLLAGAVLVAMYTGLSRGSAALFARLAGGGDSTGRHTPGAAPMRWGVSAVCILLLAAFWTLFELKIGWDRVHNPQTRRGAQEVEQLARYLREQTPPEAVVSSHASHYLYLVTGRKTVPMIPATDAIDLLYAPDATFLQAGRGITPQGQAAHGKMLESDLVPYLEQAGATHVVAMHRGGGYAAHLKVIHAHPNRFRSMARVGPYEVFRFRPPG